MAGFGFWLYLTASLVFHFSVMTTQSRALTCSFLSSVCSTPTRPLNNTPPFLPRSSCPHTLLFSLILDSPTQTPPLLLHLLLLSPTHIARLSFFFLFSSSTSSLSFSFFLLDNIVTLPSLSPQSHNTLIPTDLIDNPYKPNRSPLPSVAFFRLSIKHTSINVFGSLDSLDS